MPDAALFTPAFVESFISKCHAEGLTKEATVVLLEMAALGAAHRQEGFAEGFADRMALEELTKGASWRGLGRLARRGLRFARKHPVVATTSALGVGAAGLGTLGAAGYGINSAMNSFRNHNRGALGDVPTYGGYDPALAQKDFQTQLNEASRGIGKLNAQVDANGKRMEVLRGGLENGTADGGAVAELRNLEANPVMGERTALDKRLGSFHDEASKQLRTTQEDLKRLDASRGSWWNKAREFVGVPKDFDTPERNLYDQKKRLTEQTRLAERLRNRLISGSTEFSTGGVPSRQTLQERFFPTE